MPMLASGGRASTALGLRWKKAQKRRVITTLLMKKFKNAFFLNAQIFEFFHDRLKISKLHDPW